MGKDSLAVRRSDRPVMCQDEVAGGQTRRRKELVVG